MISQWGYIGLLVLAIAPAHCAGSSTLETTVASTSRACRDRWIANPDDPRVGLYRVEPDEEDTSPYMRFLAYDGESLTLRWPWEHTFDPDCRYGTIDPSDPPSDPPGHYPLRMHARVSPDGDLFALQPCWGWIRVGRFVEGGYIETEYGGTSTYRLRRLSARELEGSLDTQLEEAGIFVCRGIYEAEGVPIPPLPTSVSHRPRGGDVPSSRASRGAITARR